MNVVFLGSGEFGIESLNTLSRSCHVLRFVVTQPPSPAGRGRQPSLTPVARWVLDHSVPLLETEDVNTANARSQIAQYQPDVLVVIAFGQRIARELINLPPKGAVNVHASLLPKYRGAAPINWAIMNGETRTGISIITLADKIDAGQVLAQSQTEIRSDETAGQLHDRLARLAPGLLMDTLKRIQEGTAVYVDQDHAKATFAPKLKKSDGLLDFSRPAESLRRKILGLWPWPGASATYLSRRTGRSMRVTVAMAEVVKTSRGAALPPGTLDQDLNVICGTDALRIAQIKPEGSRLMSFRDFANGRQTQPYDLFANA